MASKPEAAFWAWLNAATVGLWHTQRHEDKYSVGIPDVSYGAEGVNGWVELKAYIKWPNGNKVGLPHFTAKQANWLTERGEAGGHCFLLIRINNTILMFDWAVVYDIRRKSWNEDSLKDLALMVWEGAFDRGQFLKLIIGK